MTNKKILYFANANSPHIVRWIEILKLENYDIEIVTIHKPNKNVNVNVHHILPSWTMKLGIVNYILAGFKVRFFLKRVNYNLIHAHNTSGYGLMAYLSNQNYIITTYGSEIYESSTRGSLYTKLIQVILNKATKVTATSIKMSKELKNKFNINSKKIYLFTLGVNTNIFYKKKSLELEEIKNKYNLNKGKYWIINRRVTPLYNTKEVIEGFIQFIINNLYDIKLIVICGDYNKPYLNEVKKIIPKKNSSQIIFIEDFLTQSELSSFLSISDFSISVPKSDQLSASILESLACSTIPILSNLEAYKTLKDNNVAIFINEYQSLDFYRIFNFIQNLTRIEKEIYIKNAKKYIFNFESNQFAQHHIKLLYK